MITSDELELNVIGTLILEPEHMGKTMAVLSMSDFGHTGARELFRALGALFLADKPIDPLTVLTEAGEDCRELVELILDKPYYTLQLDYYCELILKESKLRFVRELGGNLSLASSEDVASTIVDRLNGAFATRRKVEVVDLTTAAVDFLDAQSLQEKPKYMTWGFPDMDEKLFAEPGDFVVIGGYPSAGKTLLSLQIAMHMAREYRVGYFSLETSPRKLMDRIMAAQAKVPLAKIKRRDLDAHDWDAVRDAAKRFSQQSLDLIRASGMTVADIRAQVLQKRYEVIFVDYLQLVQAKGTGRYEQVTAISMGLHTLSQDLGVAVIALAQLSRPEKGNGPMKPPNMTSFRESGQIEQDADIAILLYPEDPNDNGSQRVLKISKNKEGGKFALDLAFDGQTQRLTPVQKPHHSQVGDQMRNAGRKAKVQYRQAALEGFEEVNGPDGNLPF